MIASIGNRYNGPTPTAASVSRTTTAFADIMAVTTANAVSPEQAQVSKAAVRKADMARAQAALSTFDTGYNNVDHSQADFEAHFAEGAKLVSASQGLPEGQYDFTRMSDKQLRIVTHDLGRSGKMNIDEIGALVLPMSSMQTAADGTETPGFSEVPVNRFALLKASADFHSQHGYAAAARVMNATLSAMTAMHEAAGIPVTYKATAQENVTGATGDSSAKLKEALAAFKKEASMTPAQRARRDVLKTMNLTEDAIKAMPPEQQKATEQKIAAEVARRLRLANGSEAQPTTGGLAAVAAEPLALSI